MLGHHDMVYYYECMRYMLLWTGSPEGFLMPASPQTCSVEPQQLASFWVLQVPDKIFLNPFFFKFSVTGDIPYYEFHMYTPEVTDIT